MFRSAPDIRSCFPRCARAFLLLAVVAFIVAAGAPGVCRAQQEYNVWAFGAGAGIDFNGASPVVITTAINSLEGVASIADPVTGQLLFYSAGDSVYNRANLRMAGSAGMLGSYSSTQAVMIVPAPGKPLQYWLFTTGAGPYIPSPSRGLNYSIVDMALDGGMGDVSTLNVPLLPTTTEKLTAIRHADGCGFWVLAHGWLDDRFYIYRLTDQGLDAAPIVTAAGSLHDDASPLGVGAGTIGAMKASPDGTRLAVAMFADSAVEVFHFDPATGALAYDMRLPAAGNPYGVSFSPDNSKLYVSCQPALLYQFDMAAGAEAAVIASRYLISDSVSSGFTEIFSSLQLAPDGRIYHARSGSTWLGVIGNPDGAGAACGYVNRGFPVGATVRMGLPNLIDGFFASGNLRCGAPVADFTPADTTICEGDCIDFIDHSRGAPTSWHWAFPGAATSASTERSPGHVCYPAAGRYRVTLTVANGFGASTHAQTIVVRARGDLRASMRRDYSCAPGDTILLPLTLDAPADALLLDSLTLEFGVRPDVLQVLGIERVSGPIAGWTLDSAAVDQARGHAAARLHAPSGGTLQGTGGLLALRCVVYVGASDTSDILFNISAAGNPCLAATPAPGLLRVEACAIRTRLVRFDGVPLLRPLVPNPARSVTAARFVVPDDGHVSIEIRDGMGRIVARPFDGDVRAGEYNIPCDVAALPSGVYSCVFSIAESRIIQRLMIVR